MTDFSLSSALNATRLAGNHARSKGEDGHQFQMISGLLMAAIGCKMAMDAFNRAGEGWEDGDGEQAVVKGLEWFSFDRDDCISAQFSAVRTIPAATTRLEGKLQPTRSIESCSKTLSPKP